MVAIAQRCARNARKPVIRALHLVLGISCGPINHAGFVDELEIQRRKQRLGRVIHLFEVIVSLCQQPRTLQARPRADNRGARRKVAQRRQPVESGIDPAIQRHIRGSLITGSRRILPIFIRVIGIGQRDLPRPRIVRPITIRRRRRQLEPRQAHSIGKPPATGTRCTRVETASAIAFLLHLKARGDCGIRRRRCILRPSTRTHSGDQYRYNPTPHTRSQHEQTRRTELISSPCPLYPANDPSPLNPNKAACKAKAVPLRSGPSPHIASR